VGCNKNRIRSHSIRSSRVVLALVLGLFPAVLLSQQASICKGPLKLEQDLASHPSPGAYEALGSWFATQHKFSCAISNFETAVRLDPSSWQSHYDLGIALFTSGKPERAAKELQSASTLNAGSEQILLPLGASLSESNHLDEAIVVLREVLKSDPQSIKALDGLSKALIAAKRYKAAIAELQSAPPN
jgi:protein O-GlcNAc transferase